MNRRQFLAFLTLTSSSWLLAGRLAFADDEPEDSSDHDVDDDDDSEDKETDFDDDDHGEAEDGHSANEGARDDDDDDHDNALRAVQSNEIMPLRNVKSQFERRIDGKIIDIKFINTLFQKQYKFTYIDRQNRVRNAYFDAKSGAFVK